MPLLGGDARQRDAEPRVDVLHEPGAVEPRGTLPAPAVRDAQVTPGEVGRTPADCREVVSGAGAVLGADGSSQPQVQRRSGVRTDLAIDDQAVGRLEGA